MSSKKIKKFTHFVIIVCSRVGPGVYRRASGISLMDVFLRFNMTSALKSLSASGRIDFYVNVLLFFITYAEKSLTFLPSEVLMNTKTETSDLKWTIYSTSKPEVCNPG